MEQFAAETAVRRNIEITASQKLAALTGLDSDALVAEVRKLRGKKHPLTAASLAALCAEHTHRIDPAPTLAAKRFRLRGLTASRTG